MAHHGRQLTERRVLVDSVSAFSALFASDRVSLDVRLKARLKTWQQSKEFGDSIACHCQEFDGMLGQLCESDHQGLPFSVD